MEPQHSDQVHTTISALEEGSKDVIPVPLTPVKCS